MVFPNYPVLILLAPLAAGLIVGVLGRSVGPKVAGIGVAAEVMAFVFSLVLLYEVTTRGPQTIDLPRWSDGILQFGMYIDRLSAVMLVHIAAISTLIHLFSLRYMQQERGYTRFHSLLAFTTFVLFGMVSSANILMLFAFWQLLSWLLPLLSYNDSHPPTVRGAFRTFIMQRLGDVAFLAAVVLAYSLYGTLDFQQLFSRAADILTVIPFWPGGGLEIRGITAVTLLIFIGAMSKSAQFPLHMWLPDSLYAPTPVHALLHAGIINAGGFLLCRLAPLYALSPATLHMVFAVGMLTALLGSSMMLVQNDIKKTLGYSTIGQMGFMIMECGLGAYGLAIFHLIAHGLFKGTIFLNCGYVIHAARQEPRLPPKDEAAESGEFSNLTWLTGFITTLILPLIIVLAAHGILNIPLRDSQGTAIFLFFGWATSSQAILTLYRLKAVASWKVAVTMLSTLFVVVITYLLAAESFTHFLFPASGEVTYHFRAGALPVALFDLLVTVFALTIIVSWVLIYAGSHGKSIRMPAWVDALQVRIYLLLMNRLYLDALSMRLRPLFAQGIESLNGRPAFSTLPARSLLSLPCLPPESCRICPRENRTIDYRRSGATALSISRNLCRRPHPILWIPAAVAHRFVPAVGLYGLVNLSRDLPIEILRAVNILALVGALYGSLKALGQVRVPYLLAYASLAFYSALWWHFAATGRLVFPALVYVAAVAVLTSGLLLAWQRLRRRYGNLTLDRMHGLARPMPRFAALFSLLVMAGVGLPPFALFFRPIEMLLQPSLTISSGLWIILLMWFLASWYLFRMMQRLLFGPHRVDMLYEDLRSGEVIYFVTILVLLAVLGTTPPALLESSLMINGHHAAMEMMLWPR